MRLKLNKGFTLIELLVVIAIIAILTSIAVMSYTSAQKKARDGKRKADLENIRGALEMRHVDFGSYPTTANFKGFGNAWSEGTYSYMQKIPVDPKNDAVTYGYTSDGTTYTLCAYLESPSATDSCTGGCCSDCTFATCNYSVTQP